MTHVVDIARKCRAKLAAEIAKLDGFISMADKLIKYDQKDDNKEPDSDLVLAGKQPEAAATGSGAQL